MYSKRMRSRIERARRLLKTTAVLGQTLRDVLEPDPTDQPTEPFVEGSFRVVEPEKTSARGPDVPEVEVIIITPPEPDRAGASPGQKQAPPQPANAPSTAPPKQSAGPRPEPEVEQPGRRPTAKQNAGAGPRPETPPLFSEIPIPLGLPPRLRQWIDQIPTPQPTTAPPRTEARGQDKGQFLDRSYTNEAGTRAYKLYVPSGYHGQALPLVVMLHGCTQSPDDFAASTRMNEFAETHTFFVAYPAQTFKANIGKCWNWFKESEQQRDLGEPAIIAGLTRQIIKTYHLDSRRVYVAGISAGGAMAMVLGATYPDLYAAAGIQSGVPYGVAHNIPTGLAAIKGVGSVSADRLSSAPGDQARLRAVPTIVFHGDQDSLVHPGNGDQIIAQWLEVGAKRGNAGPKPQVTVQRGQVPGGHAYTRSIYHDGSGAVLMEQWLVHGAGHAWSGGNPDVAWTDAKGPNASQEMLRFFYEHPHPEA